MVEKISGKRERRKLGEETDSRDGEVEKQVNCDVKIEKQPYRYSQSRWNTNRVVSSIKIRPRGTNVKFCTQS